jgi:hypothetical protein
VPNSTVTRPAVRVLLFVCAALGGWSGAQDAGRPTTATPQTTTPQVTASLVALAGAMRAALLSGDEPAYLALTDLRAEPFATEHRRFARDAARRPPRVLTIGVRDVTVTGDTARATLTWAWQAQQGEARQATFPATFTRVGGEWRYAGEALTRTPGAVNVSAQPAQQDTARALAQDFPNVYARVTRELAFTPARPPAVKLYDSAAALSASVALNLGDVGGWNEPDEAIKLARPSWPAARATRAHELTHFVMFERHGDGQKLIPWWLHEGVAQFVASGDWTPQAREDYLRRSVTWAARNELVAWTRMADYDATPLDLWPHVYRQGYAFTRYVVETYGMPRLTTFLTALSSGESMTDASTRAFGRSFETLDGELRSWLAARPD